MTEFQSRRELREAERQGLVAKPEQVFDLPTGQISLPTSAEQKDAAEAPALPTVGEMLTRRRMRELERDGLLDPLTGAVPIAATDESPEVERVYDEVIAETEEPITSSIRTVSSEPSPAKVDVTPTDIFHSMAIDPNARKPRTALVVGLIVVVLAGLGVAAYMLGIFK